MFIAHLPAGYILTKTIQKKADTKNYLWIGLLGSIFPDLDLFYFYLIDGRQTLHHDYWIHTPFYWLSIGIIIFTALWIFKKRDYFLPAILFFSNIFLHLLLDTVVGKIAWLFPLSDEAYYLFDVPAVYGFWVYNFIFHWTFLFEVGVVIWAAFVLMNNRKILPKNADG